MWARRWPSGWAHKVSNQILAAKERTAAGLTGNDPRDNRAGMASMPMMLFPWPINSKPATTKPKFLPDLGSPDLLPGDTKVVTIVN